MRTLTGYASTIAEDQTGEIILPTAFAASVANIARIPLLISHDHEQVAGIVTKLAVYADGLWCEVACFDWLPNVAKALQDSIGFSIGARPVASHMERGRRVHTALDLSEISLATSPANIHARLTRNSAPTWPAELEAVWLAQDAARSKARPMPKIEIRYPEESVR